MTAPPTSRGKLALRVRVGFREVAPQRRRHLARLDAGHALAWDDGHPGRSKIAVPGGEIEEVASAEGIGEGGSSPGLVDGDVRVTLRRTVDVVEASFVAATDGRALGSATFVVKSAIDAEARALLFHEHRTLLVPLASGRLALLRYDTSTWNQA